MHRGCRDSNWLRRERASSRARRGAWPAPRSAGDAHPAFVRTRPSAPDRPRRSVRRARPPGYFFFLAGGLALLADLGADLAPAFADVPFVDGFDAEPLLGALEAAFAGALADAFAGAFAAALAGAFAAT